MTTQGNTFRQFAPPTFFQGQQVGPAANLEGPFADFLEQEPQIPFQGALQRAQLNPNQRDFFRNQFSDIFGQFQGLLDQQIRAGLTPDLRFADFVGNFDFGDVFQRLTPDQRQGIGSPTPFRPLTTFTR